MTFSRGRGCCWGEMVSTAWRRLGWPCSALAEWAAMRWRRWLAAGRGARSRRLRHGGSHEPQPADYRHDGRYRASKDAGGGRARGLYQSVVHRASSPVPVFLPETADQFDFVAFDYVIDAVDTVSAKIALVEAAFAAGVPIVSSMARATNSIRRRFGWRTSTRPRSIRLPASCVESCGGEAFRR